MSLLYVPSCGYQWFWNTVNTQPDRNALSSPLTSYSLYDFFCTHYGLLSVRAKPMSGDSSLQLNCLFSPYWASDITTLTQSSHFCGWCWKAR